MGTAHNKANVGDIADKILLPGDPLRAKFIAENFLENAVCYNDVRGMLGYTGYYKGKRVSVQGTGMGMPSIGIYAYELINVYGVKRLIRIGTCGSTSPDFKIKDVVIAQAAATNSGTCNIRFRNGIVFPPVADFNLLRDAVDAATRNGIEPKVATVFSSDLFYNPDSETSKLMTEYGVSCVEMECAELFVLGARYKAQTLGIMTVSDQIYDGVETTPEERQTTFTNMMKIALDAI